MARLYKVFVVFVFTNLVVLASNPQMPLTRGEERLYQLKLKTLQRHLCQNYITILPQNGQGKIVPQQHITVFEEILSLLQEIAGIVDKITRNKPDDPLRDVIPRLKKLLVRIQHIEDAQTPVALDEFLYDCYPYPPVDEPLPMADEQWKNTDAYMGPSRFPYQHPTQLIVDEEDNLFVLDRSLKQIFSFDAQGKYIPNQFDEMTIETGWIPGSIAMSDGIQRTLWVYYSWQGKNDVPPSSGRIKIYTQENAPNTGWNETREITACHENLLPLQGLLVLDREGNLIVVDQESGVMTKCDQSGKLLYQWGKPREDPTLKEVINRKKLVVAPRGVTVNLLGVIYVSDISGIQRYYPDGEWIPGWFFMKGKDEYALNHPYGVAVDDKLFVYIADTGNHRIKKYSGHGEKLLWHIGRNDATPGENDGEFHSPEGIAINSEGTAIYVADTGNARIQRFVIQQ